MIRAWLLSALLTPSCAWAGSDVYIRLGGQKNRAELLDLALPAFTADNPAEASGAAVARQIREIVRADLLFSRYFNLLEDGKKTAGWLLTARASAAASKISVQARLTDLHSGETVFERYYRQDAAYVRAAAHRLADDVVQAMTGKPGIAHSWIALANNQTGKKEIYLMDYDGAGLRRITSDASINLLPRFSPDRRQLVYTSYKNGNPDLMLFDIAKGRTQVFSAEQGLNLPGGFSPDGTQLLMTLSRGQSPNLYIKEFPEGGLTRLTQHFGADSSPTFSPDAGQVAFVSDRSGNPQIYILDLITQRAKRLTGMNWCDSPAWSPTGEWLAFSGRAHHLDKMDIFLVDVTGNQVRQITRGEGSNENPSWSPDGRFIVFTSTRNGRSEIFVMDADGSAPHPLTNLPGNSFTPSWSN